MKNEEIKKELMLRRVLDLTIQIRYEQGMYKTICYKQGTLTADSIKKLHDIFKDYFTETKES